MLKAGGLRAFQPIFLGGVFMKKKIHCIVNGDLIHIINSLANSWDVPDAYVGGLLLAIGAKTLEDNPNIIEEMKNNV